MACFEDYEVLSIVGTNLNSTCYKVKNKRTKEIVVWKAINYEQCDGVLAKLKQRKQQQNDCLLTFHDHILHEETNTVYLVTEYCKHGSIASIIRQCKNSNERFSEDFLWSLIYKLANFIKTHDASMENINIYDTFIDIERNVKLLNFTLTSKCEEKKSNIYHLGALLQQMIQLNLKFEANEQFPAFYSNDLHNLLKFLTQLQSDVTPTCDSILCHPTVLRKHANEDKSMRILVTNPIQDDFIPETRNQCPEQVLERKLENLRKRDAQLKSLEGKLQERERNLIIREKKVALMERIVKEKTTRAELYLKRARTTKPSMKGKSCAERIDTSFSADCGDSSIIATSHKLNLLTLPRPAKFTRTMSEKRVRFKSHSPLKEIHAMKREIHQKTAPDVKQPDAKAKKKFALSAMFINKKSSKKANSMTSSSDSVSVHTYEDLEKGWEDLQDCRPIDWTENVQTGGQWTQDSKKQAFDLLRLMNAEDVDEIKHTFL